MMSNSSGFDRPFPGWFPYMVGAILLIAVTLFLFGGFRSPSAPDGDQGSWNSARYKPGKMASKGRA
jgi:hypothetical protein